MCKYYHPHKDGTFIKGEVVEFKTDKYGNEVIVLKRMSDSRKYKLPGHSSLRYQCKDVREGDILKIFYNGKKISENGYEMHDYTVDRAPKGTLKWSLE